MMHYESNYANNMAEGRDDADDEPPKGECDCCGKLRPLFKVEAFGIETFACSRCCALPNETIHEDGTIEVEGI